MASIYMNGESALQLQWNAEGLKGGPSAISDAGIL